MTDRFSTTVTIHSNPAEVWKALTYPNRMIEWMGEPEMQIEIQTDWKVNAPIFIRGFHHIRFENKGIVLQFDKGKILRYSHLSSVSRLPDIPENYSVFEFILEPKEGQTLLTFTIDNFPSYAIRKHLEFYWRTTVFKIKQAVESVKSA